MFSYHKPFPNSVLKILQDMFSNKETSGIFFTNDLMVLIDIILRQLTDLADGDKVRLDFFSKHHFFPFLNRFAYAILCFSVCPLDCSVGQRRRDLSKLCP